VIVQERGDLPDRRAYQSAPAASTHVLPDPVRTAKVLLHAEGNPPPDRKGRSRRLHAGAARLTSARRVKINVGLRKRQEAVRQARDEKEKDWKREQQRLMLAVAGREDRRPAILARATFALVDVSASRESCSQVPPPCPGLRDRLSMLPEPAPGEVEMVGRSLPADTDVFSGPAAGLDRLPQHGFHRRIGSSTRRFRDDDEPRSRSASVSCYRRRGKSVMSTSAIRR